MRKSLAGDGTVRSTGSGSEERALRGGRSRNDGLDLLRSFAILLVLVSHFGGGVTYAAGIGVPLAVFVPGYFGVELFFILSGFLIGNLLFDIAERDVSPRALGIFLLRRAMRTMPVYFLCLMALVVIAPPLHPSTTLPLFAVFAQNLAWPFPEFWFPVTWSLTIEEWFYLSFSAFMIGATAFWPGKGPWIAIGTYLFVPLIVRLLVAPDLGWDDHIRKLVITRLDAIAYGVALAGILRKSDFLNRRAIRCFAIGLAMLFAIAAYWLLVIQKWNIDGYFWRTFIFNLTGIGFALVFPIALRVRLQPGGPVRQVVLAISAWSYGLYLVHLSILVQVSTWLDDGPVRASAALLLALLGSFVLAWLLHICVEKPILSRRPRQFSDAERSGPAAPTPA